ncbi:MAG: hypothetical protein AAGE98_09105 [Actinomycetota bacterium]
MHRPRGMGAISISRRLGRTVAVAGVLVLGACADETAEPPIAEADTSAARSVAVAETPSSETVPVLADPEVNPEGVIFAAILLETGGDVDMAMADGMFTRDDLDAARDGLEDGSLAYLFD